MKFIGPFERQVEYRLIEQGGQAAGKLEVAKISLEVARSYAEAVMEANGRELDEELPNFDQNFLLAKRLTAIGRTQRKDMPVILDGDQVRQFQQRLKDGRLDIHRPFSPDTEPNNPFPEGMSGAQAKEFLERGLRDNDLKDDRINVRMVKVAVKDLKPIQRQIYFDKSIKGLAEFGAKSSRAFMEKTLTIMSKDHYIIDGHHRWSASLLLDPNLRMSGIEIDLPIAKLLPLSLAYGDAIGNRRNQ